MRIARSAAIVTFLVVLLTWLSVRALNPNAELFDHALMEIDRFAMIENALYRDVFTARTGTLRNYDPLVREISALYDSLDRLRMTAAIDAETTTAVDRLVASTGRQEELVEQFKSDNALLHNSLSFFGRFTTRLGASDPDPAVSAASAAMLHLTLDTSPAAATEVQDRLNELAARAGPADDGDSLRALLAHGRLLHDLLPTVDNTLKAMQAVPRQQGQDALRAMILKRQLMTRTTARHFRRMLYAVSLLLVGFLVHLGLRLRARATALQRRAAFEHVIAGISMRFINVQPQQLGAEIDRALANMATWIGSDRAYFVLSGAAPRVHVWCKPGSAFPQGWPERAPALAARLGPAAGGIIQVPSVASMPAGENKEACIALGLGGWVCVTNVDNDGASVALGFDTIGRRFRISEAGEFGLLRTALDTIVFAIERSAMERERARLETRLQQARRMEMVGTFTSGIAHNFNNILGGILGHSEVIEEHLGRDAQPLRNLDAIRRAAERARDLVDQILTFGRRRDARRGTLSVQNLFAEAASVLNVSLSPGIELAIYEPSARAVVSGELTQLQQVIINLCNNAAQATGEAGRIEVDAEVHEVMTLRCLSHGELQPGRYVSIAVTDNGRGMDGATLARIFEPFFTTRAAGNGLGLATVREIVREHGGVMNVASTPGVGSRFEIWLPCLPTPKPVPSAEARSLGSGETVLMFADDRAQLLRDEEMLAALGYEPVGFTGKELALAACRTEPERFDLLVVGHQGSPMASLELAAALHAAAPHLPVVLATKSTEEIGADTLMNAGIADVVHWPIVAAEIAAALDRCLAPRKLGTKPPSDTSQAIYSLAD
jgi:signal transduction histidine kinase